MQNSHPQQSPKHFLSRIYITLLFHLRGRKKICESMKNAPIYRSAEIMQFVCELFNALVVFYTHSHSQTLKSKLGTGNWELGTRVSQTQIFTYESGIRLSKVGKNPGSLERPAPLTNSRQLRTRLRCWPAKRTSRLLGQQSLLAWLLLYV